MKRFNYADEKISSGELMIAIPSLIISVGILTLPKSLATETIAADGWISIVAGGIITMVIAWCIAKLATRYPGKSFMEYTSALATKPVAIILTLGFSARSLLFGAYQVRMTSEIAKSYLFDRTPPEIIGVTFLLVVVYAVSGTQVGIFRLNMLFFPLIIAVTLVVLGFSAGRMEMGHLQPMFQSSAGSYWEGIRISIFSYLGIELLWFYSMLLREPKKAPRMALIGVAIPMVMYVLLFIVIIGVFGNSVTANLLYPAVELAKSVIIPGEFFERFESVFFVIWTMAIFNTTAILMDLMVFTFRSVFKNASKLKVLYITTPIIFFIGTLPTNIVSIERYVALMSDGAVIFNLFVIVLLFSLSTIRRTKT